MGIFSRLFGNRAAAQPAVTPPEGPLREYEASMNFDLETVRPFLARLRDNRKLDFDVEALARYAEQTELEDERELSLVVGFEGRRPTLRYGVFMDDIDAPDLYFFSADKALIDAINAEYDQFAEDLGI